MPARRSARLKAKTDEPVPSEKQTQEPKKTPKRKAPSSNDDNPIKKAPKTKSADRTPDFKSPGRQSKPKATAGTSKTGKPSFQTSVANSNGQFSSFPPEILNLVIAKIEDTKSLGNLSKTCKAFHSLVIPQLYKRVQGFVTYHAHIAKLIRTIEPLLTIEQRKQLKKEGQYKGQQESFPDKADDKKKPEIADFVRQAMLDIISPGKKHGYIVYRYAEELLKSINNLEVFAATSISESMAKTLAIRNNLQALWLHISDHQNTEAEALAAIRGLKHLRLYAYNYIGTGIPPLSLIWNSRSTLRSLQLNSSPFKFLYKEVKDTSSSTTGSSNPQYDLSALKSLSIKGASIDPDEVDCITRAIDFTKLENLNVGYKNVKIELLFKRLIEIFSAATSTDIKLRSLSVHLGTQGNSNLTRMVAYPEEEDHGIEFISSFSSLTSLTIVDAGVHSSDLPNPGFKDTLLRGIFTHTNLAKIEFGDSISLTGWQMPCLDTQMVKRFIENFLQLKHFHFYAEENQFNEIAETLSPCRNLESILINRGGRFKYEETGPGFLRHLTLPILERGSDDKTRDYKWEDHSKFSRLTMGFSVWEVGSKLGKAKKGIKKAEKISSTSNSKRKVMYRDITHHECRWLRGTMNEMEEWVDKVAKDLD
ncbi:hypothetical protein QX201_002548 [Fusarium graminearum]